MNKLGQVLIIEDCFSVGVLCSEYLNKVGYGTKHVENGADGQVELDKGIYDLVLLDVGLPDCCGTDMLNTIKANAESPGVIIISAQGSIQLAVDAMKQGADDFLMKPFNGQRLITSVKNTLERLQLRRTVKVMRESEKKDTFQGFIGQSLPMQAVYRAIDNVAGSTASVFITGESGTGKEICAEAIHETGNRSNKSFVPLNCAAIPKDLIESEIFGHLKGSFTGAVSDRDGAAFIANGGTLFLDEICEMDINLQSKLLRFLQTGKIQRLGSDVLERVDVRIICATNRDPVHEVEVGRLREDLFYRLNVIPIHMPPLRTREDDMIEIANHFLAEYGAIEAKEFEGFSDECKGMLRQHMWPGNVRELQNTVRHITVMNSGGVVEIDMLPALGASPRTLYFPSDEHEIVSNQFLNNATVSSGTLDDINQKLINGRIKAYDGSIPKAAASLGVSPSTIYRKVEGWQSDEQEDKEPSLSVPY